MTRVSRRFWIGGAIGAAVVVALALWLMPARVNTVRLARREVVQTVGASGRVLAAAEVVLRARTSGEVMEVLHDVGALVQAGELVVRLDDREASAAREEARAALERELAGLREVRGVRARGAGESLRRTELEVEQATLELARIEALAKEGAAPARDVDDARHALAMARSQRELAAIDAAGTAASGSSAQIARAAVMQAKSALLSADARLSYTRIEAPASAVVTAREVEVGDIVQTGDVLMRLVRRGPVRLVMEPDERNLALLEVGQSAVASAEAFPEQHFAARLSFLAPTVDLQRGTVEVRFDVPSPPPFLRADMTVSIETEVARKKDARVLPASAIRDLGGTAPFALVVDDGRAARRALRLGVRDSAWVEVTSGLKENDDVIVDRAIEVGTRVRRGAR